MCLTGPKPPREQLIHPVVCCDALKRGKGGRITDVDCDVDRGADATTVRYQIANSRRHVSLRVLLRLTAMDVCCGPPARVPTFLPAN